MTLCTLKTSPSTIHIVRGEVKQLPGWIVTWCGRKSALHIPTWLSYRHCRKCERLRDESALAGELHGGNLEGIPPNRCAGRA